MHGQIQGFLTAWKNDRRLLCLRSHQSSEHHSIHKVSQVVESITDPFTINFKKLSNAYLFFHKEVIIRSDLAFAYDVARYSGKQRYRSKCWP